jgi:NAD-dependent SIR2 family protein deacetylase
VILDEQVERIRESFEVSEALFIGAGAGIGVDSGLPDFRGTEGFWRAYPPLANLGIRFEEMANPRWFHDNPSLAWGFYGHRLQKYKATIPHEGFSILRKWTDSMNASFVFTSNVDGQFQTANFSEHSIMECHGSIHFLQCLSNCGNGICPFPEDFIFSIDQNLHALEPLPRCPSCNGLARPNILMFSDFDWDSSRVSKQNEAFQSWVDSNKSKPLMILEMGAGLAVPTVRLTCEELFDQWENEVTFLRINPRDVSSVQGVINLKMGALEALQLLDQ